MIHITFTRADQHPVTEVDCVTSLRSADLKKSKWKLMGLCNRTAVGVQGQPKHNVPTNSTLRGACCLPYALSIRETETEGQTKQKEWEREKGGRSEGGHASSMQSPCHAIHDSHAVLTLKKCAKKKKKKSQLKKGLLSPVFCTGIQQEKKNIPGVDNRRHVILRPVLTGETAQRVLR